MEHQIDQECPQIFLFMEGRIFIDFYTWNSMYGMFLEPLRQKGANNRFFNNLDHNQDDQEGQEYPPSVFFKRGESCWIFLIWNTI